ncbi:unnamed protein product [Moneuplotes crassus]|uniref:Uncharacterized protein n=1 Tax=Euplotes crassus TaxID=5936 RepID=A0AAD1UK27_EUPCR|nr:unnamed protein product [Moneuplotes crassus]
MESQVSLHLEETKAPSPSNIVSKAFLTTVPLVLKILPYFGWADECKILMTQLRSQSRSLWFSEEDAFLTPITDEHGVVKFHLPKRELKIRNLAKSLGSTRDYQEVSELKRLMVSNDYKLYLLAFDFDYREAIEGLGVLRDFLKRINLKTLSLSVIRSYFKENHYCFNEETQIDQIKQLDLLLKITRILGKDVRRIREDDRTCYRFPKPFYINCTAMIQPIMRTEDLAICGDNFNGSLSIEEECISVLQYPNGFSVEDLWDYFIEDLEFMPPRMLFRRFERCALIIKLPEVHNSDEAMTLDQFKKSFTQLFALVENHKSCVEKKDLKIPKVKLKYRLGGSDIGYEEALKALEFISSCFHYLKNHCVAISLEVLLGSSKPKNMVVGGRCYLTIKDEHGLKRKVMKLTNFSGKFTSDFVVDQGFIQSNICSLECEGIEEVSPTDLEEVKLPIGDISVFIPLQEVKTLKLDYDEDAELSEDSFQKWSELKSKVSYPFLGESDSHEKLQVFHKPLKVWIEIERPCLQNDAHIESRHALFEVLDRFNLEELDLDGYRINDEAMLASINSLLEKQNITRISVRIGASHIENEGFERLFNALSAPRYSSVKIRMHEASLDKVKTAKKFVKKNIGKDISIRFVDVIKPEIDLGLISKSKEKKKSKRAKKNKKKSRRYVKKNIDPHFQSHSKIKKYINPCLSLLDQCESRNLKPRVPTFVGSRFRKLQQIFKNDEWPPNCYY